MERELQAETKITCKKDIQMPYEGYLNWYA